MSSISLLSLYRVVQEVTNAEEHILFLTVQNILHTNSQHNCSTVLKNKTVILPLLLWFSVSYRTLPLEFLTTAHRSIISCFSTLKNIISFFISNKRKKLIRVTITFSSGGWEISKNSKCVFQWIWLKETVRVSVGEMKCCVVAMPM